MNIHVGALQQQHEAWKAARQRLLGAPRLAAKPMIEIKTVAIVGPAQEPEWKRSDICFDDHVLAWRSLVSKLLLEYRLSMPHEKRPAKEIILEVLEMFPGVNLREIQGPSRNRKAVRARQVAMYELATQRPDLSSPVIGSIFGDRDHTTVLHAVSKIKALKEAGECLYFQNNNF